MDKKEATQKLNERFESIANSTDKDIQVCFQMHVMLTQRNGVTQWTLLKKQF